MALTQLNQLAIAFKKLSGKTHTNSNFGAVNESIGSSVQLGISTIFGETIPSSPSTGLFTTSSGIVEKIAFELSPIDLSIYIAKTGSLAANASSSIGYQGDGAPTLGVFTTGHHAYALKITSSYQANSDNPEAGTTPFINGYHVSGSNGTLQLVPEQYGPSYIATVKSGSQTVAVGNEIDYYLDYYSGILFVQDYSATTIPTTVEAYIYIGKYADEVIASGSAIPLDTGSFLITASNGGGTDNNITFTKGNGTTFDVEIVSSSYALNSTNTVNAQTSSYVNTLNQDVTINGTITAGTGSFNTVTAQVLQVNYISSSVIYSSGSNIFGDALTDTQTFTGSVNITGSNFTWNGSTVIASNVTSSMSVASASIAQTALTASSVNVTTEIFSIDPLPSGWKYGVAFYNISASEFDSDGEITSGVKLQGSKGLSYRPTDGVLSLESNSTPPYYIELGTGRLYASGTTSGNYEIINTGGGILLTPSGGFSVIVSRSLLVLDGITGSLYGTASWAENVISASYALTASYVLNAVSASFASTASYVLNAVSASFASTASFVQNAQTASYVLNAVSASFASTASYVLNAVSASFASTASFVQNAQTASYVLNAVSASFASTASFVRNAQTASYVLNAVSASFASTASYVLNAVSASFASTASSVNTLNQNVTINGNLTAGTSSLANLTVTNNAIINGDLFVYGSSSVINVENLSIEDKFILLNSGALGSVPNEGGIIVQTSTSDGIAYGTALYYDQEANRWLVAKSSSVAYNDTSIGVGGTTDFIVTVSASVGAPVGSPYNFGTGNSNYSVGQMYINTTGGDIYIYA
jgi:hypothetical protein